MFRLAQWVRLAHEVFLKKDGLRAGVSSDSVLRIDSMVNADALFASADQSEERFTGWPVDL